MSRVTCCARSTKASLCETSAAIDRKYADKIEFSTPTHTACIACAAKSTRGPVCAGDTPGIMGRANRGRYRPARTIGIGHRSSVLCPLMARAVMEPASANEDRPARLSPAELRIEQQRTLETPRQRYSLAALCLFWFMDACYGRERSLSKFKVLEVVARVPYQAWENVAYVAVTHRYSRPAFAERIFERVQESRKQQDNEQWHLLILEELVDASGRREPFIRYRLVPQVLAFIYYQLSWLLYAVRPSWSYRLNADFEDHAEHEYAHFVDEHPELEDLPYHGLFADAYGHFDSLADLFRQIGHDERVHKDESLARMREPRFSVAAGRRHLRKLRTDLPVRGGMQPS